jgi:hypothetical protein
MKRIVTLNSVYEVDEEKKLVWRTENTQHAHDHRLGSPGWKQYEYWIETNHGAIFYFDGGYSIQTSRVQAVEEV